MKNQKPQRGEKRAGRPEGRHTGKSTGRPTGRPQGRSTEKPTSRPFERFEDRSARKTSSKSSDKFEDRPAGKSTTRPSDKFEDRPARKTSSRPSESFEDRPTEKPSGRRIGKSISRPTGRPEGRPTGRPGSKQRPLDPVDAKNRKQKEARLLREKAMKENPNAETYKPHKATPKPGEHRESKFVYTPPENEQDQTPKTPDPGSPRKSKSEKGFEGEMRLNKFLAHCGIASRRAVDVLIMQGHATVNGEVVQEMGYKVKDKDVVAFKGKVIKPVDKLVYYLLNKPRNVITTSNDEKGRKTVMDIIAAKIPERIYPVGRLDRNTSGLILLTNDGELTKKLSHPSHKVPKVYLATLDKNLSLKDLELIRSGINLEDGEIKADSLHYLEGGSKREVQIEVHSGRNRLVRRIFEHLGYDVVKLDRTYYAGLTKKNLPRGIFRPLTKEEVRMLKHFT